MPPLYHINILLSVFYGTLVPHDRPQCYTRKHRRNGNEPNFDKAIEIKEESNDSIAYVNIKKLAEKSVNNGESNSFDPDIFNYASSDKDFLLKQIALIGRRGSYPAACGG